MFLAFIIVFITVHRSFHSLFSYLLLLVFILADLIARHYIPRSLFTVISYYRSSLCSSLLLLSFIAHFIRSSLFSFPYYSLVAHNISLLAHLSFSRLSLSLFILSYYPIFTLHYHYEHYSTSWNYNKCY